MTLVDSSGWIEYFTDGPLADRYQNYLKHPSELITPTVVLYEVYKVVKRKKSEEEALAVAAQMGKSRLIALSDTIALTAADVSLNYKIAMADAFVYATALCENAKLITSDRDLAQLPDVTYLARS